MNHPRTILTEIRLKSPSSTQQFPEKSWIELFQPNRLLKTLPIWLISIMRSRISSDREAISDVTNAVRFEKFPKQLFALIPLPRATTHQRDYPFGCMVSEHHLLGCSNAHEI